MCHDVHGTEFREYFDLKIDLRVLKCPVRYWMHTTTSIQHWKTTKLWLLWQNSVHYFVTKWYMVTNGFLCMSLSQHDKAKSGKLSINGNEQSRWKLPNILCTFSYIQKFNEMISLFWFSSSSYSFIFHMKMWRDRLLIVATLLFIWTFLWKRDTNRSTQKMAKNGTQKKFK